MHRNINSLMEAGCTTETKDRVCRSRGGESCAFDGAMIVLQPIADAAHIVHGPISCCGNSWEGRGALSRAGAHGNAPYFNTPPHRMGLTTDMQEMEIVYGSEKRLYEAIKKAHRVLKPRAIFVYSTCVSGLIGEDIDSVCRGAQGKLGIPVIPVNAPGFVGPKNLGNRIAGEVLLDYVIGTGEPPAGPPSPTFAKGGEEVLINLIGEYNIAGDLWLVEPVLREAGIRVLSRITGDSTYEEITYAHRAQLNVLVCSRALINVAKGMEKRYGTPYIEASFFGKTEMSRALKSIAAKVTENKACGTQLGGRVEALISREEETLDRGLGAYEHLKGKRAVLYTGGVKSWSFISALLDLGIEIVAVGTKKSTFHDEEKMKEILGEAAPLVEDVSPGNLLRLLKERNADILVAGGRNQYLAIKEGYPFVDVNQERHIAYAGYRGLLNLAEQISAGIRFYAKAKAPPAEGIGPCEPRVALSGSTEQHLLINPLKHSQSMGAAIVFQGVHNALPVIHGAQGCSFLGKVLLTKHFREPIALASSKLFAEDVVMGGDENLSKILTGFMEKNNPEVIGVLTSGLSEVKGDDVGGLVKNFFAQNSAAKVVHVATPDYEGGLETGYARAVETLVKVCAENTGIGHRRGQINIIAGPHLTPADFTELKELSESFGLKPILLPDLSALDGSRQGISPLASGGTRIDEITAMGTSEFTLAIGPCMERAAGVLKQRFDIEYKVFDGISGLRDADMFMNTLSCLSGKGMPEKYERQRRCLRDGMRDAHFYYGNKRIGIALEPDHVLQLSRWLDEMGATVKTAVIPQPSASAERVRSERVVVSDLFSARGEFDLLISNSHAEDTAKRLGIPLYQTGFPVYKVLGGNSRTTIGYRGSLGVINDVANLLMGLHDKNV